MTAQEEKKRVFVARLMSWGERHRRDFAWRKTSNEFHILLAEFMLQRTNARQVEPVYREFIRRYPAPEDLTKATKVDIVQILRPLGLAYRATRLKQIADIVKKEFDGKIPASGDKLLQLPGVGRYMANAVLCFAFKHDVPLVDANILRVAKRVFSLDVSAQSCKKIEIWSFMAALVVKGKARDFNLSILDFASLVCTPRNPHHDSCSLQDICDFFQKKSHLDTNQT